MYGISLLDSVDLWKDRLSTGQAFNVQLPKRQDLPNSAALLTVPAGISFPKLLTGTTMNLPDKSQESNESKQKWRTTTRNPCGASGCDFNSGKKTISRVQAARTGACTF